MVTKVIELEGIADWPKLFESNRDTNEDFHGPGGAYTINLQLEQDQLDILSKSGSRLKPKITEKGLEIKLRRKHTNATYPNLGGPPKLVDAEGNPWDTSVFIGSGSRVKCVAEVYETKIGKGTRLLGVQVLDLVAYEGDEEGSSDTKNLPDWLK